MSEIKNRIPVKEGLFTMPSSPDEKPRLIASRCPSCGEVHFPKPKQCMNCQEERLDEIILSPKGRIYSYSIVMQRPGRYYQGPVPYAFGWVEIDGMVRVQGLFICDDFDDLKIGLPVELVVEKLTEDENGNEIVAHKFKLIKPSEKNATDKTVIDG